MPGGTAVPAGTTTSACSRSCVDNSPWQAAYAAIAPGLAAYQRDAIETYAETYADSRLS